MPPCILSEFCCDLHGIAVKISSSSCLTNETRVFAFLIIFGFAYIQLGFFIFTIYFIFLTFTLMDETIGFKKRRMKQLTLERSNWQIRHALIIALRFFKRNRPKRVLKSFCTFSLYTSFRMIKFLTTSPSLSQPSSVY